MGVVVAVMIVVIGIATFVGCRKTIAKNKESQKED
jgi:hypothetical protein